MSSEAIGIIGVILMLLLMFLGMPIGFALAIIGFIGSASILGLHVALPQLHITFYSIVSNYNFTVLPFFILMGYFADASGISSDLYLTAEKWLRRLPGGLALATVAGCAAFAAVCGSSVATTATMGVISLREMRKCNYDIGLAAGTVAAGGTLGFLIPPSVAFVIYGIVSGQSIGKLLLAGYIPGILLAIIFMVYILLRIKINPQLAPVNPVSVSWKEKLLSLRSTWSVLVVIALILGGLYLGFFTATEAGGVGAFLLFFITIIRRKLTGLVLFNSLRSTASVCAMIFVILLGAYLFGDFLTLSGIPVMLVEGISAFTASKYIVFAIIVLIYLILGCFIESVPMIIITIPVIFPVITALGFDPIWFGVIVVLTVQAALITPPVGLNVYVIVGILHNEKVSMGTVFKGAAPFVGCIIVMIIILTAFPQIAMFLPNLMK